MELEGKTKELFEKWFFDTKYTQVSEGLKTTTFKTLHLHIFYSHDKSMQYGIYVDFFDSVGINISLNYGTFNRGYYSYIELDIVGVFKTRHQARAAVIKKAVEILNNK